MKKLLTLLLTAIMMLSVTACGEKSQDVSATKKSESSIKKETKTTERPKKEAEALELGAVYTTDNCEITFNNISFMKECKVQLSSHSSTSKSATEGNTLIVLDSTVKNIGIEELNANSPENIYTVYALYNDKYNYKGSTWFTGEDAISPLATKTECMTIEVPIEVAEATESLVVYVKMGNETFQHVIR